MKQARYKEPLPLAVIEVARAGDAGAVEQVLQYYNSYINKLCTRTLYDDCGQLHVMISGLKYRSTGSPQALISCMITGRLGMAPSFSMLAR